MNNRSLLNIALFVLLLALGATAYNISQQPAESAPALSTLKPASAQQITIQFSHQNIVLSKQNNQWHLDQPISSEADDFRVHSLLDLLSANPGQTYDANDRDLKQYGLDIPLATLTINDQQFQFGKLSPVNEKRFCLHNGKLALVEDTFFGLLTAGYKNLMRRHLLPSNTQLNSISTKEWKLYRNDKSAWELSEQGEIKTISADQLKKFIDNWVYIQAFAIFTAQKPFQGTEITINTDNKVFSFLVQRNEANTVVINKETGLAYQFDARAIDSLISPLKITEQ